MRDLRVSPLSYAVYQDVETRMISSAMSGEKRSDVDMKVGP
jgi:hypothetical protein